MYDTITVREIVLEPIYLTPVELIDIDSRPLLDEKGNPLRAEDGNILYEDSV